MRFQLSIVNAKRNNVPFYIWPGIGPLHRRVRDCGKHEISIFPHLDHQAQEELLATPSVRTGNPVESRAAMGQIMAAIVAPLQGLGELVPGDPPHGEVQDLGKLALLVRIPGIEYDVKEHARHSICPA